MKYIKLIPCAYLIVFLVLQGCGKGTVKVGLLMDDYKQERWERDRDILIKKVEELGGKILIESALGDDALQFTQAEELLKKGVDILIVVPANKTTASKIVEAAHKKGVEVISYDRLIKNCDLDFYVSFDNVEVGRLQAEYLTTVRPTGNYAIIGGATYDNNSFLLRLGQMSVIQPYVERGDIKIVYDQFVDVWHKDEGYKHMNYCLESCNNKVEAVIAANDALAEGAIKALDEHGLAGKVLVSGQDAELEACQRIVGGTQTMTVYKPIEAIATTAAKVAFNLARNEPITEAHLSVNNGEKLVPAILLPPMVVNKETIKLTVVADGYLKEQRIFE